MHTRQILNTKKSSKSHRFFYIAGIIVFTLLTLASFGLALGFLSSALSQISSGNFQFIEASFTLIDKNTSTAIFLSLILFAYALTPLFLWRLSRNNAHTKFLLNHVEEGICIVKINGKILSFNKAFTKITGLDKDQIINHNISNLFPDLDITGHLKSNTQITKEFEGTKEDGSVYSAVFSIFAIKTNALKSNQWAIALKDITQIKKSQSNISRLAFSDELTGLANRSQLIRYLDHAIKTAKEQNNTQAILYIDLDGFKDINDTLGHDAGDEVLQIIGKRLKDTVRNNDFVARLGGDEFCIVLDNLNNEQITTLANRCVHNTAKPMNISNKVLHPRISIGISQYPKDGDSKEILLQTADTAMYAAKRDKKNKNRYKFYLPDMTVAAERRLSLEHELRDALSHGQFALQYQPQICLKTGIMIGVEALIRWQHPTRGMIPPDEFINIAERIGLITELGEWVIHTACQQLREWIDAGLPDFTVSVNISGSHFRNPSLVETVATTLKEFELDPKYLELEITEGVMQVSDESIENFKRIKELEINIAIDDFGTGFSSLSSLQKLPLDCIKIDREFICDVLDDQENSIIIATIIGMGHALGLKIIAEGVEYADQITYLLGLNCDAVQGYYFSRPVPPNEIPELAVTNFLTNTIQQKTNLNQSDNIVCNQN